MKYPCNSNLSKCSMVALFLSKLSWKIWKAHRKRKSWQQVESAHFGWNALKWCINALSLITFNCIEDPRNLFFVCFSGGGRRRDMTTCWASVSKGDSFLHPPPPLVHSPAELPSIKCQQSQQSPLHSLSLYYYIVSMEDFGARCGHRIQGSPLHYN